LIPLFSLFLFFSTFYQIIFTSFGGEYFFFFGLTEYPELEDYSLNDSTFFNLLFYFFIGIFSSISEGDLVVEVDEYS
jgi:hypothetical protein